VRETIVKEIKRIGKTLYICEECGFVYKEKEWAQNASISADSIKAVTWKLPNTLSL